MYSKARFDTCPVCGEHVDLDEHTECMPLWSVSTGMLAVEPIRAETPEAAACRYVKFRDDGCTDGTIGVAERGGLIVVYVTNVSNGKRHQIAVTGTMVPSYEATCLVKWPQLEAVGNPHTFEY